MATDKTVLYLVIPCYNEEKVLPITSKLFLKKLTNLIDLEKINDASRILFVNDGSSDRTWEIICSLSKKDIHFIGISQSRNRGHQAAVLAGLMEAKDKSDITISMDCDGQDDINAVDAMLEKYRAGAEIVYGARCNRKTDSFFKRTTAELFYKLLKSMGVETVFNHADFRLVSRRVLQEFSQFHEVNLFLRGMFPLVGFKSDIVYYERHDRVAGKSHYPLSKMLSLAWDGITSLTVKPLHFIVAIGTIAFPYIIVISIPLMLIYSKNRGNAKLQALLAILISLLCGYVNIIRSQSALPVMLTFITMNCLEAYDSLKTRSKERGLIVLKTFSIVILILIVSYELKEILIKLCFIMYNLNHHSNIDFIIPGCSAPYHSLYIGLGWHSNPFGIQYSDGCAAARAYELAPGCTYCSKEYMLALKHEWLRLLSENPIYFIKDYLQKLFYIISSSDNMKVYLYMTPVFITSNKMLKKQIPVRVVILTIFMLLLSTIPGLIAIPNAPGYIMGYLGGLRYCVVIYLLYILSLYDYETIFSGNKKFVSR